MCEEDSRILIRLRKNGPVVIEGDFDFIDFDKSDIKINNDKPVVALCRCGASKNKPFCDGTHRNIEFDGSISKK